jgi:hypothetical protein
MRCWAITTTSSLALRTVERRAPFSNSSGWYSRWHNRRHGRSAHLFRAHFFARELTDGDLLVSCRYVAYNPVAAGLSNDPFSWPWSSAAASAGIAVPLISLERGLLRAALDDSPDWQRRYRGFIEVGGTGLEPVTSSLSSWRSPN